MTSTTAIEAAMNLYSSGKFGEALAAMQKLLKAQPGNVEALNLAAACAWGAGKLEDAEGYWQSAVRARPDYADAHNNLGMLFQELKRNAEAAACFRRVLALRPDYLDAYFNLGVVLQEQQRRAEAETCYRRLLSLHPDHAAAHFNLGVLFRESRRHAEAAACFRRTLALRPDHAAAHNDLGVLLQEEKSHAEAEACFRRALALRPDFAEAHNNLGVLLQELKRYAEAEACIGRALSLRSGYAEAHNNLGIVQQRLKRYAEAEACFRRALSGCPDYAAAHHNLGILLQEQKRHAEAEACFRRALSVAPDYAEAKWNLSLLLLFLGRFDEGWPLYESRFDQRRKAPVRMPMDLSCPQWSGEDLRGKSIVVWPEQGFGDEIQFVRYLSLLRRLGASRITLVCKPALKALFLHGATGADQVLAETDARQLARHDFWTFPLSLPRHFKTTPETIPADLPYLAADGDRIRLWAARLPAAGFRVGLVWKGFAAHRYDGYRSLPGFASLAPLWSVAGATFVSLQRGQGEDEASLAPPGQPVLHLGSDIRDFADTAAIVAQLDLVICVDTAVAHLAGALGKPCWVLLPAIGTDWRWQDLRADSPWYPGVMRLFRQAQPDDWADTVGAVAAALAVMVREFEGHRPP